MASTLMKVRIKKAAFLFLVLQTFQNPSPALLQAAESPPFTKLSLREAVRKAIEGNVDIQVERENIRLRTSSFLREQARFDPEFLFDIRAGKVKRRSTLTFETDTVVQENQRLSIGVNQRLRWGGDYDLSLGQRRSTNSISTVNPTYNGDLILSFTQPLLQDYGSEITEAPLRIAQTEIVISQEAFQSQVSNIILGVSNAYWDLLFQIKNLAVKKQTLQSAKQLLASSRAKVELGLLAPIEILVAEAGVASREEAVVIAEKGIRDQEDQLRLLLNLPAQSAVDPPAIHPTDRPKEKMQPIESAALLESALTKRPEISENQLRLQNSTRALKVASNQLSPSLDLVGNVGLNGLDKDFSGEIDRLTSRDFNQWEAGLVLSFPIGNKAAYADLQKEKANLNIALLSQRKIVQQISLETKEGIRRVQTDFQRILATQRARRLAEEKRAAGNERFQLGLISSHDLLEFQDDLADAQGKELKAVIDYNKSLINLDHVTGKLLEKYRIETVSSLGGFRENGSAEAVK